MHVVVHCVLSGLLRCLEQRPDVNVVAHVGKRCGDDFRAAVVAVLPHLGDHDARTAAFLLRELVRHLPDLADDLLVGKLAAVNAGNGTYHCLMPPTDLLHRVGDLAQGRAGPRGLQRQSQQVALAGLRGLRDGRQTLIDLRLVAVLAELLQARQLRLTDGCVIHLKDLQRILVVQAAAVHANDLLRTGVDVRLTPRGRLLNAHLGQPGVDSRSHAAQLLHLLDVRPRTADQFVRQRLHVP